MEASQTWNGIGTSSSTMKDIGVVAASHLSSFMQLPPTDNNDTNKDSNTKDNNGNKSLLTMPAPGAIKREISASLGIKSAILG